MTYTIVAHPRWHCRPNIHTYPAPFQLPRRTHPAFIFQIWYIEPISHKFPGSLRKTIFRINYGEPATSHCSHCLRITSHHAIARWFAESQPPNLQTFYIEPTANHHCTNQFPHLLQPANHPPTSRYVKASRPPLFLHILGGPGTKQHTTNEPQTSYNHPTTNRFPIM